MCPFLQVATMCLLTVMSSSGKVTTNARKKKQDPLNTVSMVLSFLATTVNLLLVTVFQGQLVPQVPWAIIWAWGGPRVW